VGTGVVLSIIRNTDINIQRKCCLNQNFQNFRISGIKYKNYAGAIPCGCPRLEFVPLAVQTYPSPCSQGFGKANKSGKNIGDVL